MDGHSAQREEGRTANKSMVASEAGRWTAIGYKSPPGTVSVEDQSKAKVLNLNS